MTTNRAERACGGLPEPWRYYVILLTLAGGRPVSWESIKTRMLVAGYKPAEIVFNDLRFDAYWEAGMWTTVTFAGDTFCVHHAHFDANGVPYESAL